MRSVDMKNRNSRKEKMSINGKRVYAFNKRDAVKQLQRGRENEKEFIMLHDHTEPDENDCYN